MCVKTFGGEKMSFTDSSSVAHSAVSGSSRSAKVRPTCHCSTSISVGHCVTRGGRVCRGLIVLVVRLVSVLQSRSNLTDEPHRRQSSKTSFKVPHLIPHPAIQPCASFVSQFSFCPVCVLSLGQ